LRWNPFTFFAALHDVKSSARSVRLNGLDVGIAALASLWEERFERLRDSIAEEANRDI
jgi:hypothetical protein